MNAQQQPDIVPDTNRLVWVISKIQTPEGYSPDQFNYKEKFRSDPLVVPPDGKKRLLMRYLAAEKFLGQAVKPAEPFPDGGFVHPETGEVMSENFGKPLKIVELTAEEKEKFGEMSIVEAQKHVAELELQLANKKHTKDGQDVIAVGKGKPQALKMPSRKLSDEDILSEIQRIDQP